MSNIESRQLETEEKPRLSGREATLQRLQETGELTHQKTRQQIGHWKTVELAHDDSDEASINRIINTDGNGNK